MTTAMTARTRRLMARLVAVGALALLLGTLVAPSASAYDRHDALVLANRYIDACLNAGGEPLIVSTEQAVEVYCMNKDGTLGQYCVFWPNPYCGFLPNPSGTHPEIPTDGVLDGGATPRNANVAPVMGNGQSLAKQNAQQDDRPRGHKPKKHRHQRGKR